MNPENPTPNYFVIIPSHILDDERIDNATALLFGRLLSLTSNKGYCWASNKYLAELNRCKERELKYRLKSLQDCGYIKIQTQKNGCLWDRKIFLNLNYEGQHHAPREVQPCPSKGSPVPKNNISKEVDNKETTPPLTPPRGEGSADAAPIERFSAPPIKSKIKEKPKIDEKPLYGAVVRLSESEHTKLCQDHGSALVAVIIEEMNDYCLAHGKKYKDYAAAIRNWIGKRKKTKLDPNKRTFAPSSTIEGSLECLKRAKVGAI